MNDLENMLMQTAQQIEQPPQDGKKNDRLDRKLRWELLPLPLMEEVVRVYTAGSEKYGPDNWQRLENGYERYEAALLRHLNEAQKGNMIDADTGCLHIAQVAWNAIAMLHFVMKHIGKIAKLEDGKWRLL